MEGIKGETDVYTFQQLTKILKKEFSGLPTVSIALLGDTATQFLAKAIRGTGYLKGFDLQIWEADFNQIEQQVFDPFSELYAYAPQVIIVFQATHKLLLEYHKINSVEKSTLADKRFSLIKEFYSTLSSRLQAKIIFYNYYEIDDAVFGNFANKNSSSFLYQVRKLNYDLMKFVTETPGFYVCDLSSIQNRLGSKELFSTTLYINTEMVISVDAIPIVAQKTVSLIGAFNGLQKKCLVLDLDNTLWGGIIGDDGIENIQIGSLGIGKAFTNFQYWIKELKNRGILLAICSKNTESIAKEPFISHSDMVIRLEDIALFVANWNNKVDNLHYIQQTLNIGFDSMVFLDDNPFERNMVRQHIPDITVPELPIDPADYLEYLYSLNLFETISYSEEDLERTTQYQVAIKREEAKKTFANEEAFLESLAMVSVVAPFTKFSNPRVAQLSQRSNQFNLRTVRYSEADIEKIASSPEHHTFSFTLEDIYGDHGLVCVIILKIKNSDTLFIDTWLMSCRVLKRGLENFVLNTLVAFAIENGYLNLEGEYLPTGKNDLVRDHYLNLGFESMGGSWVLGVNNYQNRKTTIFKK